VIRTTPADGFEGHVFSPDCLDAEGPSVAQLGQRSSIALQPTAARGRWTKKALEALEEKKCKNSEGLFCNI
jgi:hypothetical protein